MSGIIFLGNCQAFALSVAYNRFCIEDSQPPSIAIDGRHVSESERVALMHADTIAVQLADLAPSPPSYLSRHTKVVLFPYVSGGFLWPYATEEHVHYGTHPMGRFGVYGGETGDAFLNRLIKREVSAHEALDAYMALDVVNKTNLSRRFDLSFELQDNRDRLSDMQTADFIRGNFRSRKLFQTRGHLTVAMFLHLARQVFARMGASDKRLTQMERELLLPPFPCQEHPIHPQVAAYYALAYGQSGFKFHIDYGYWTFEDYVIRYMTSSYSHEIHHGLKMLEQGRFADAALALEEGSKISPDSAEVFSGLGKAYDQLGNTNAALRMFERAAGLDPRSIDPLLATANIFFRSLDYDRAKIFGKKALGISPYDRHALHMVNVCDARINEREIVGLRIREDPTSAVPSEKAGDGYVRVAVIGNSNSVMRNSYVARLAGHSNLKIDNWSIGATPNIVLFNFLIHADVNAYDLIIVETAVMDAIQIKGDCYPEKLAASNLRRFLKILTSATAVRVAFLILPTRFALVEPNLYVVEDMYRRICAEYMVSVFNVYEVLRHLIGNVSAERVTAIASYALPVTDAFGLPRRMAQEITWRALRQVEKQGNALGINAFLDDAHIGAAMHACVANWLDDWISKQHFDRVQSSVHPLEGLVCKSQAVGAAESARCTRRSSLISRELVRANDGDTWLYPCPKGYSAIGLLINQTKSSAYLTLQSNKGSTTLDCRYPDHISPWSAVIVPIADPIGDGDVTVRVTKSIPAGTQVRTFPGTGDHSFGSAELGELLLLSDEVASWEQTCDKEIPVGKLRAGPVEVDNVGRVIAEFFDEVEATNLILPKLNVDLLKKEIKTIDGSAQPGISARCLLLMGEPQAALETLAQEMSVNRDSLTLFEMHQALSRFLAATELKSL